MSSLLGSSPNEMLVSDLALLQSSPRGSSPSDGRARFDKRDKLYGSEAPRRSKVGGSKRIAEGCEEGGFPRFLLSAVSRMTCLFTGPPMRNGRFLIGPFLGPRADFKCSRLNLVENRYLLMWLLLPLSLPEDR